MIMVGDLSMKQMFDSLACLTRPAHKSGKQTTWEVRLYKIAKALVKTCLLMTWEVCPPRQCMSTIWRVAVHMCRRHTVTAGFGTEDRQGVHSALPAARAACEEEVRGGLSS